MKKPVILIFIILLAANLLSAQIINIPADYPTIQEGIDAANSGDTVLVAPGEYSENLIIEDKCIVLASWYLETQDTTYISQTIIQGSLGPDGVVLFLSGGFSCYSKLIGFTIQEGHGYYGGGVSVLYSGIKVEYSVIKNNYAVNGGGIGQFNGHFSMKDVKILNNHASYGGGVCFSAGNKGKECNDYQHVWEGVVISGNIAYEEGGGIYRGTYHGIKLINFTITNNTAKRGGGIYSEWEGGLRLRNGIIKGNTADYSGGGIYSKWEFNRLEIENVEISDNTANSGGGLYFYKTFSGNGFKNVLIKNNHATTTGGGGVLSNHLGYSFTNSTIADNIAEIGDGFYCVGAGLLLTNSIIYGSNSERIVCDPFADSSFITIDHSLIMGGQYYIETNGNATVNWLEGNINQNPQFVNTGDFPYQINDNSPCIDAGSTDTTGITEFDLAGEPRFFNNRIDMGAYEWNTFVGVDEQIFQEANNGFLIYPNPAQNKITISTNNQTTISQLNIYNQLGQKVLHLESPASTIDISEIGKGLFVVEIVSEGDRFRSKLIKN